MIIINNIEIELKESSFRTKCIYQINFLKTKY